MKTSLKTLSRAQLDLLVKQLGQPAFRGKQLYEWLYLHRAISFDDMTNLPKSLREALSKDYCIDFPTMKHRAVSNDGTRKYLFEFEDGCLVESVGIPSGPNDARLTVCFSTQVGCAMGCAFCATGKEGFTRNLTIGEIVDQVLCVQDDFGQRVTNLVGMGQGEPFLNYDAVLGALNIMNDPKGIAIGARHITVSTCGILQGIQRFSTEPQQFTLAISLHSAIQEKRDKLMPHICNYTLAQLKAALLSYVKTTNRRVTLEYLLIKGVNDSTDDLAALVSFCDGLLCHVNILPLNDIDDSPWKPSSLSTRAHWISTLESNGIEATTRLSRGSDINGACGQLKNSCK